MFIVHHYWNAMEFVNGTFLHQCNHLSCFANMNTSYCHIQHLQDSAGSTKLDEKFSVQSTHTWGFSLCYSGRRWRAVFYVRNLRKYSCCHAFFTTAVLLAVHDTSSDTWTYRSMKLDTLSTISPLMQSGMCPPPPFLNSMISTLIYNSFALSSTHCVFATLLVPEGLCTALEMTTQTFGEGRNSGRGMGIDTSGEGTGMETSEPWNRG